MQAGFKPGIFRSQGGRLTTRPTRLSRKVERGRGGQYCLHACFTSSTNYFCECALMDFFSTHSMGRLHSWYEKWFKVTCNARNDATVCLFALPARLFCVRAGVLVQAFKSYLCPVCGFPILHFPELFMKGFFFFFIWEPPTPLLHQLMTKKS